jgi:hypothetical protein
VRALAASGFGVAFLCLTGAAYLGEPAWRYALLGVMAGLSLGLCASLGAVVERTVSPARQAIICGMSVGVVAAVTRQVLLAFLRARAAGAPPQIRPASFFAAVFTIVGGLFALLWGCAALRRLMAATTTTRLASGSPPAATGAARRTRALEIAGAGAAVALGLYGISPLGLAVGLRVNHWTFLGLAALALIAYGVEEAVAWVASATRHQR